MNSSSTQQPRHDAGRPFAGLEIDDYEEVKNTKARLDKARQEVDKKYEALSRCHMDNITYAKAELDYARQKEKSCFEDFEWEHNQLVEFVSHFVRPDSSAGTRDTDELGDDTDTSPLGLLPEPRRRIRAPTRASARPEPQIGRRNQAVGRRAAARGLPKSLGYFPFLPGPTLGLRAKTDARLKALIETVATGNASQDQKDVFQGLVDDIDVKNSRDGFTRNNALSSGSGSDPAFLALICLQFCESDSD